MERVHVVVHGVVQGVFFRHNAIRTAQGLGLNGWVRNRSDGTVEAAAEGPRDLLEQFVEWCHHGPAYARVDSVDVSWETPTGEPHGFRLA
ncbi:MAG: acylphosphatase [bacterium]